MKRVGDVANLDHLGHVDNMAACVAHGNELRASRSPAPTPGWSEGAGKGALGAYLSSERGCDRIRDFAGAEALHS